jgi:hypothetical protein
MTFAVPYDPYTTERSMSIPILLLWLQHISRPNDGPKEGFCLMQAWVILHPPPSSMSALLLPVHIHSLNASLVFHMTYRDGSKLVQDVVGAADHLGRQSRVLVRQTVEAQAMHALLLRSTTTQRLNPHGHRCID